jgi:hypothetical protein
VRTSSITLVAILGCRLTLSWPLFG